LELLQGVRRLASKRISDNLAYHAARILLVIARCGTPRSSRASSLPGIQGRTLLAKLDFFIRYPAYLRRAIEIQTRDGVLSGDVSSLYDAVGIIPGNEERSVEAQMVRYRYGPWDHIYYETLAYLIGKELIEVKMKGSTEIFRVTPLGQEIATALANEPAYEDLGRRADVVYRLFNKYSGNSLRLFIYNHFPEVVNRELGAVI
jgi:hypothetical protein